MSPLRGWADITRIFYNHSTLSGLFKLNDKERCGEYLKD